MESRRTNRHTKEPSNLDEWDGGVGQVYHLRERECHMQTQGPFWGNYKQCIKGDPVCVCGGRRGRVRKERNKKEDYKRSSGIRFHKGPYVCL